MIVLNHHYVVCYSIRNPAMEILDKKKSRKLVLELYGDQVTTMEISSTYLMILYLLNLFITFM